LPPSLRSLRASFGALCEPAPVGWTRKADGERTKPYEPDREQRGGGNAGAPRQRFTKNSRSTGIPCSRPRRGRPPFRLWSCSRAARRAVLPRKPPGAPPSRPREDSPETRRSEFRPGEPRLRRDTDFAAPNPGSDAVPRTGRCTATPLHPTRTRPARRRPPIPLSIVPPELRCPSVNPAATVFAEPAKAQPTCALAPESTTECPTQLSFRGISTHPKTSTRLR